MGNKMSSSFNRTVKNNKGVKMNRGRTFKMNKGKGRNTRYNRSKGKRFRGGNGMMGPEPYGGSGSGMSPAQV